MNEVSPHPLSSPSQKPEMRQIMGNIVSGILSREDQNEFTSHVQEIQEALKTLQGLVEHYLQDHPLNQSFQMHSNSKLLPESLIQMGWKTLEEHAPEIVSATQELLSLLPTNHHNNILHKLKDNVLGEVIVRGIPSKWYVLPSLNPKPLNEIDTLNTQDPSIFESIVTRLFKKDPSHPSQNPYEVQLSTLHLNANICILVFDKTTQTFWKNVSKTKRIECLCDAKQILKLSFNDEIFTLDLEVLDALFEKFSNVEILCFSLDLFARLDSDRRALIYKHFPKVQTLQFRSNYHYSRISPEILKEICTHYSNIRHLCLTQEDFGSLNQERRDLLLTSFSRLESLQFHLPDAEAFNSQDQAHFQTMIQHVRQITLFGHRHGGKHTGRIGLGKVLKMLQKRHNLKVLNIHYDFSRGTDIEILTEFLKNTKNLDSLALENTVISDLSNQDLARLSAGLNHLDWVGFFWSHLQTCTCEQIQALFSGLAGGVHIDLSDNHFFLSSYNHFEPSSEYPKDRVRLLQTLFGAIPSGSHLYWNFLSLDKIPTKYISEIFQYAQGIGTLVTSEKDKNLIEKHAPQLRGKVFVREGENE